MLRCNLNRCAAVVQDPSVLYLCRSGPIVTGKLNTVYRCVGQMAVDRWSYISSNFAYREEPGTRGRNVRGSGTRLYSLGNSPMCSVHC